MKIAEQFADGLAPASQLEYANRRGFLRFSRYSSVKNLRQAAHDKPQLGERIHRAAFAIDTASTDLASRFPIPIESTEYAVLKQIPASIFRDIFGNRFQPVEFVPDWRTSTVLALSRQMYDSWDYTMMPILADALQDSGCENDIILNHCRGEISHVRGCWVLDALLGKE